MEYLAGISLGYLFRKQASVATGAMVLEDFLVVAADVAHFLVDLHPAAGQPKIDGKQCVFQHIADVNDFELRQVLFVLSLPFHLHPPQPKENNLEINLEACSKMSQMISAATAGSPDRFHLLLRDQDSKTENLIWHHKTKLFPPWFVLLQQHTSKQDSENAFAGVVGYQL